MTLTPTIDPTILLLLIDQLLAFKFNDKKHSLTRKTKFKALTPEFAFFSISCNFLTLFPSFHDVIH